MRSPYVRSAALIAAIGCATAPDPATFPPIAVQDHAVEVAADDLAASCLESAWLAEFHAARAVPPVVKLIPAIKHRGTSDFRSGLVLKRVEGALLASSRVRLAAMLGQDLVNDVERARQHFTASASSAKHFSGELPADFTLQTSIYREKDAYLIVMELVRVKDDEKVWISSAKITPAPPPR